jgi:hypothetical protein
MEQSTDPPDHIVRRYAELRKKYGRQLADDCMAAYHQKRLMTVFTSERTRAMAQASWDNYIIPMVAALNNQSQAQVLRIVDEIGHLVADWDATQVLNKMAKGKVD